MYRSNRNLVSFSKQLRKNMTESEKKLWYLFLRKYPVRFQRQKILLGEYIVDFYCARARLVIEVDGGGHTASQNEINDFLRAKQIEENNIHVLRITNEQIKENFYGVCDRIDQIVQNIINNDS